MRTRRNVVSLIATEKTDWPAALKAYRAGVEAMRAYDPPDTDPPTPPTDKRSWQYLAAVHGRAADGSFEGPIDHSDKLWSRCQHGSWFFFPWHRMYLLTLESFVQHHTEDPDWALPYWYAVDPDNADSDVLPKAFLDPSEGNALYLKQRSTLAQTGQSVFGPELLKQYCDDFINNLKLPYFSTDPAHFSQYGNGYGGAEYTDQNFNHGRGGAAESVPHGVTHDHVGVDYEIVNDEVILVPPYGFMGFLKTAARDPIFWLHHSNIDRLWQMWLDLDPAHKNPNKVGWLNSTFTFPTPDGGTKKWRVGDVLDTTAPALNYVYDTVAPPSQLAAAPHTGLVPRKVGPQVSAPIPASPPQVIGATRRAPIAATRRAEIALSPPAVRPSGLTAAAEPPRPQRWLLSVEGITGTVAAPAYNVYVNLANDALPIDHPDLLAGTITTFGVRDASRADDEHGGSGLTFVFDITAVHDALEEESRWNPDTLDVVFVPLIPPAADEAGFEERLAAAPPRSPDLEAARIAVMVT
jgi:tyrosinase